MGFDLGMALGGAAKTGVDTYTKLQEEDRLAKAEQRAIEADKRTAEQFQWQRDKQAGERSLQTAASNVANMGDTQNVPDQAAMANPQGAYQQYEGADGPVTPMQAVPISAKDKQKMFVQQALKGGANPLDVMNYQKGSLELKALNKQADREDQFDDGIKKIQDQSANHLRIAASGNGKELVKIANKEGLDVREKQNKDGTLTYEYYEDGKLAKTFNDANALAHAGNELLLTHWMKTDGVKLLGSPAAVGTYLASQKKEKQEDKKIDILQQDSDTKKTVSTSEINKNNAYATYLNNGGRSGGGGAGSADNQEKLTSSQAEILMKGQPGRFKSSDEAKAWIVNAKLKGADVQQQWSKTELELEKQGLPPEQISLRQKAFFVRHGYAPDSVMEIASMGVNPETKKPFTEQEKKEFYKRYPNSIVEFGEPPAASTVDDKLTAIPGKGYTPEPNSRAAKAADKRKAAIDLRNKEKDERAAKVKSMQESAFNPSTQFDVDKDIMPKEALVRKYNPLQRALTPEQFDYLNQ